jgi:hypothetical protein
MPSTIKFPPFPSRAEPGKAEWQRWYNRLVAEMTNAAEDIQLTGASVIMSDGFLHEQSARSEDIERLLAIGLWQ